MLYSGLAFIKLVRKQPIIALYFESETVLKFYNLEARASENQANHDQKLTENNKSMKKQRLFYRLLDFLW